LPGAVQQVSAAEQQDEERDAESSIIPAPHKPMPAYPFTSS
jgi:hypothetical protein